MNNVAPVASARADAAEIRLPIHDALHRLWDFGRNAVVGWRPIDGGILILVAPVLDVLRSSAAHPRLIEGRRLMDWATLNALAGHLGSSPTPIPVAGLHPLGNGMMVRRIEAALRPYCVTKTRQRAVCQIDISGFSLLSPEDQAAQLSLLSHSLNVSNRMLVERGRELDLSCTTTGDGFYIWNKNEGLDADIDLFCLMMLMLAHQALRHRGAERAFVPTIRTCFGIGSHYNYFRLDRTNGIGGDYIVGDITISLARLIDQAAPNQILISDFHREFDGGGDTDGEGGDLGTSAFIAAAGRTFDDLEVMRLDDDAITRISHYLTGPRKRDGSYAVRRREIVDKHGGSHFAFNTKLNIFLERADPLFLGHQEKAAA